jgi:hypothetical protein
MSEPTTMRRPAPPRSAVAAPVREWLAVDIADGETLSAADLLRLLDRMRQELSRHLVGSPGAFVGYDSLTVPQRTVAGPGRVIVEARLMGWSEQLHDVEYLAVSVPSGAERPAATDPLLVRGTGRTLHVEC